MSSKIPHVHLNDFTSNASKRQTTFVQTIGDALAGIGFFILTGHGVNAHLVSRCYDHATAFFSLLDRTHLDA